MKQQIPSCECSVCSERETNAMNLNSKKLDEFIARNPLWVEKNKGKFVIFNQDVVLVAKNISSALRFGNEAFGVQTGFVVRQIGSDKPVLSKR